MVHIVWLFIARTDLAGEFEQRYNSAGEWARLFSRALGYCGTDLMPSADAPHTYLVIDKWDSLVHFERFKAEFATEYADLDRACESLTVEERRIGVFTVET